MTIQHQATLTAHALRQMAACISEEWRTNSKRFIEEIERHAGGLESTAAQANEDREWLKRLEYALHSETMAGAQLTFEFWEYLESIGLRKKSSK